MDVEAALLENSPTLSTISSDCTDTTYSGPGSPYSPESPIIATSSYKKTKDDEVTPRPTPRHPLPPRKPNFRIRPPYLMICISIVEVVDFGCAELEFLVYLKNMTGVEEILCVDIDRSLLEAYKEKGAPLISEYLHTRTTPLVVEIYEGSVTHNDKKLEKVDAVICIELIEHLYPDTLGDLPYNIFGYIKPKLAIMTTPNADFNVLFPNFSGFRHPDHKFEWTRQQFRDWAENITVRYPDYIVTFDDICKGPEGTERFGACSQMAIFHRLSEKDSCNMGVEGLFKTVAVYEYPFRADNRSDEEKILDEAAYYIRYLSFQDCEMEEEVPLKKVLDMLQQFHISLDILRTILEEASWTIINRESGPVVLVPPRSVFSDYTVEEQLWSDYSGSGEEDDWNRDPGPPPGSRFLEEESYSNNWDSENWDEEPSIIIPQNNSVVEDNTFLFDGEYALFNSKSETPRNTEVSEECTESSIRENPDEKPLLASNVDHMSIDDLDGSFEGNTPSVLNESAVSTDSFFNLKLGDITENSSLDLVPSSNPQDLNFQEYVSTSRASTSPEPYLLQAVRMDKHLNDDSMCNQSMSACWTLNNSFRQEGTLEESTSKELSPKHEYNNCDSLRSIYLNTSYEESEDSDFERLNNGTDANVKRNKAQDNNVSRENQKPKLNSSVSFASNSTGDNQPQFTSSPKVNTKANTTVGKRKSLDRSRNSLSTIRQFQVRKPGSNNSLGSSNDCNAHIASTIGCSAIKEIEDFSHEKCIEIGTDSTNNSNDDTLTDKGENLTLIDKEKQSVESMNCDTTDFVHEKDEKKTEIHFKLQKDVHKNIDNTKTSCNNAKDVSNLDSTSLVSSSYEVQSTSVLKNEQQGSCKDANPNPVQVVDSIEAKPSSPEEAVETPPNSWSPEVMDSGYPNSASAQDITPEYDLSSIAQDHISDSEPPSIAEAPRVGLLEPVEVENGDLANNNRDGEGNNMMAAEVHELEDLQPLIDVLENDLENENDIYALENDFPMWLLRILDMANPIDVEMQIRDNRELRFPDRAAGDNARHINMEQDEGFNSSSEDDSDLENNEMRDDDNSDINENAGNSDNGSDQWTAGGT
ncbi:hen1 methyltransferase isoform X2 [Calliopsis andreniformis]|uniref:hen1 methyltransferase isoform X2 n=1 Tax=Calliopsis andreniformis TaxID=337506 RepID=UPI003FCE577F